MNYTPTQFSTVEDKAKFVKQFITFVEKDFPQHLFTKVFYQRLSNTFGHIAHYNRDGFWHTFFTTTSDKFQFLQLTMQYPCYGDPAFTFCDAEKEIQRQLNEKKILEKYQQKENQEIYDREFAEYQRLKNKFE